MSTIVPLFFNKITSSEFDTTAIVEGQLVMVTDTGSMWLDIDATTRVQIGATQSDVAGNTANILIDANKHTYSKFYVAVANWNTTAVIVNNRTLYTYTIALTNLYDDRGNVFLGSSDDTVPTEDEEDAYNCVVSTISDDTAMTLTLYAESIPTTSFYLMVKGTK